MNNLPQIVAQAGAFITRCGFRADVYAILPQVGENTTEFRVKGNIHYPPNNKELANKVRVVSRFFAWHVSGRSYALHESGLDIVGEWPHGEALTAMAKMPVS